MTTVRAYGEAMRQQESFSGRALPIGIVPSLNTPFAAGGAIDAAAYGRLIDYVIAAGCAGALLPAVAGEVGSLTRPERERLIEAAASRNAGRLSLIFSGLMTGVAALSNFVLIPRIVELGRTNMKGVGSAERFELMHAGFTTFQVTILVLGLMLLFSLFGRRDSRSSGSSRDSGIV